MQIFLKLNIINDNNSNRQPGVHKAGIAGTAGDVQTKNK